MKMKISVIIAVILLTTTAVAQKKKDVFITIDDTPIYTSEFKRVYMKNLDLVQDESQKSVDGYLDLFIDYKLKVEEAYAQDLDEAKSFKEDYKKYQNQLSRNYLYEDRITTDLAKEAFERSLEEVEASHVLIKVTYNDIPQDTIIAYNKIVEIRKKALAGEDITKLAKQYSEEPGAKERGGYLGYFSAFTMVFPFENAAFNTPVGEISEIVRTSYGYHFLKVTDRRKKPRARSVSHIMVSKNSASKTLDPKQRINEIQTLLKQGESFESLAKQFSEDKNSGQRGGSLKPFTKGQLRSPLFEGAAFSLKTEGEVSEPVKSEFGWHLIRLDSILPIPTFEEKKAEFEKRVADGNRNKIVTKAVNKSIKEKYNYKVVNEYMPFFESFVTDSIFKNTWKPASISSLDNKVIFTLSNGEKVKEVRFDEFSNFIERKQSIARQYKSKSLVLGRLYEEFETEMLREYFVENLEADNQDFAAVIGEYRDGLLIFDVMRKNIWDKAQNDSIGLQKYYDDNKENYMWEQRVRVQLISATTKEVAVRAQEMFNNKKQALDIKEALQLEGITVIIDRETLEVNSNKLPEGFKVEEGVSEIYTNEDSFVVARVEAVLPSSVKEFQKVKGRVTSDYQSKIEKEWLVSLRNKYKVEVNKKALKKIKKELRS